MKEKAVELAKKLMPESIYRASIVEGLVTSYKKTNDILSNVFDESTEEEKLFILNMRNAWEFIIDVVDFPTNLMLAREINKICGERLFSGNGEIRKESVKMGGTNWIPEIPQPNDVSDKLNKISDISDPVDRAMEVFCYMSRTQAFIDGNKRVSQLLANHILIGAGIGILSIPVEKKETFTKKLVNYYETNDSFELKSFLLDTCITRVG